MNRIAILASGSGSNAENIVRYFKDNTNVEIVVILTNNPDAFVLNRAKELNIESLVFSKSDFMKTDKIIEFLDEKNVDFIVLAGFLLLLPLNFVRKFSNRIVNIHPALLPKYGGKGMYGMNVHKAVIENGESESGITIHLVNENYDEGKIVFQAKCKIEKDDSPECVAEKVHQLEYEHFPRIIKQLL
nr:phosphoribosylglycinamide formyltransferase [uncultured Marinifilum sp.]